MNKCGERRNANEAASRRLLNLQPRSYGVEGVEAMTAKVSNVGEFSFGFTLDAVLHNVMFMLSSALESGHFILVK